ncbi:monovalent cation/H+ antiporter complex subunit F [Cellulomonas sp. ATA003]|uniref:monovalent cation/H+ antiporter complex subunit F n=1 Tax=Cellulomonas sp. ATA003 TaxID=3073064 RepID=UPI002873E1FD|nr:monovalent cation/H+ antiporter complex subunit F [Cellulomonas sp. ATA003]WNB85746.1 monovalent cation/H+ antiporter complex subunit F [Cellulomonas sp. ATA003]
MTVVAWICATLLAAGGILAVVRMERGPSMLDRTIALDVLTTTLVGIVGLEAAVSRRTDTIPLLVALSLVGFVGSVTIARFASKEPPGQGRVRTREEIARDEAERLGLDESDAVATPTRNDPEA